MRDEARKPIDFRLYIYYYIITNAPLPASSTPRGNRSASTTRTYQMDRNAAVYYFPSGMTRVSHIATAAVNPPSRKALEL